MERQTETEILCTQVRQLAKDVLVLAALGGMPDVFWLTDSSIERACEALGWAPEKAREWARNNATPRFTG